MASVNASRFAKATVAGTTPLVTAQLVRPSHATTYTDGDLIANSQTAASVVPIEFTMPAYTGRLTGARAVLEAASGTVVLPKFDLLLFRPASNIPFTAGSYPADNDALEITAAAFREMVAPDIRITADDILAIKYDANKRSATNVLAVRGRFTDPAQVYNTVEAAIFGNPYIGDDTQRTVTIDNQAVQSHNHMARLEKLKFIRANAPRVSITMHYDASGSARNVRYRRWVTVHYPSRGMDEATVEIVGRPKLSLQDLTYTFDGIIVPAGLYDFVAADEEGAPSGSAEEAVSPGIPVPEGFDVELESETVSAGQPQCFAVASWDHVSDALTYELEYQIADESAPAKSVISLPGDTEVRTPYLADGTEYRFRLRTKSNGANSLWTSYINETTTSDATAPGDPTSLASSTTSPSSAQITWTNPNSPNLFRTVLYRNTANDFGTATPVYIAYGGIAEGRTYDDTGLAPLPYFWWVRAFNASGVGSAAVGPTSQDLS